MDNPKRHANLSGSCGSGVSVSEWRFEMNAGNEAFVRGDHAAATAHFGNAQRLAGQMIAAADLGGFDPRCAVRILANSSQNLSEIYWRQGRIAEAVGAVEFPFALICLRIAWPCTSASLRAACFDYLDDVLFGFIALLERTQAPSAKITAAHTIAGQARTCAVKIAEAA